MDNSTDSNWLGRDATAGLVSVIIPAYNRADIIRQTLFSVQSQTYRPIEVLIVDDGSSDGTADTAKKWAAQVDNGADFRAYVLLQPNQGAPVARNHGCCQSHGEYIKFLDSDDLLTPSTLEEQAAVLRRQPSADVVYCSWRDIYARGLIRRGPLHERHAAESEDAILRTYLSHSGFIVSHAFLFRRTAVASVGKWDERLSNGQDLDYIIRALLAGLAFVHTGATSVEYLKHYRADRIGAFQNRDSFAAKFWSLTEVHMKALRILRSRGIFDKYRPEFSAWLHLLQEWCVMYGYEPGAEWCERCRVELGLAHEKQATKSRLRVVVSTSIKNFAARCLGDGVVSWIRAGVQALWGILKGAPHGKYGGTLH